MGKFWVLEDYVREYGKETDRIRNHRNKWDDWKKDTGDNTRFYQGIRTYFIPEQDYSDRGFHDSMTDYHAIVRVLDILKEAGLSQKKVSDFCGLHDANISKWKNMEKRPNKYQWWAIAVSVHLPVELIPAFLLMIGEVYEPLRIEDQIIYSEMKKDNAHCSRASVGFALEKELATEQNIKMNGSRRELLLDEIICKDALNAFGVKIEKN